MGAKIRLSDELKRLAAKANCTLRIKGDKIVVKNGDSSTEFHPRAAEAFIRARIRAQQATTIRGRLGRGLL